MSPRRPAPRNAMAGVALAAAGVVYRRLTGRREAAPTAPPAPTPEGDSGAEVEVVRARAELAEELARQAARTER
jgi:hypothetical protein